MSQTFNATHMRIIGIVSGILLMPVTCLTAYTVETELSKNLTNNFYPATISIAIQENNISTDSPNINNSITWSKQDDTEDYRADKKVEIKNLNKSDENNTDAYIRVCIIPRWISQIKSGEENISIDVTNSDGFSSFGDLTDIEINNNSYTMGDVTFQLDENWSENWIFNPNDGYFYYKEIVKPDMNTTTLLKSVTIPENAYNFIIEQNVQLEVDILADAIQTQKDVNDVDALNDEKSGRWKDSGIVINDGQLQLNSN